MPEQDKALPENSKENLDRKLDHAIEETFPTSDPVSVSVTKGGAIDYDPEPAVPGASGQEGQSSVEGVLRQAKETVSGVTGTATEAAREAYDQGKRLASKARERYPDAERYYREGTQTVGQYAAENPLLTLLVGVGIGYVFARLVHGSGSDDDERVPDYARTRQGYSPH